MSELIIIGGGLAGCEAAWQAAQRGIYVRLHEMRPHRQTGAHVTNKLAELVCSNSLGSALPDRASGLLKTEMQLLDSFILACAQQTAVPAGGALAVDRDAFAELVTERISQHPNIAVISGEVSTIPDAPTIVASGPLTSPALTESICRQLGSDQLYFYDALAPIVYADSIDMTIAFRASRYERGVAAEGDYINCPLDKAEYYAFVQAVLQAERIQLKAFEADIQAGVKAGAHQFFESCLPIEIIAERGVDALAFGPMRPVGLRDPRTGKRPYAVAQLRQDNLVGSLYNIVGFQTNLAWGAQKQVLRMLPGLANAEFARYGMMHRNTFINSPTLLQPTYQTNRRPDWFFAGQITGVEGYLGNAASGLLAGINAARLLRGESTLALPTTTMLGALSWYITHAEGATFQPMKANYGILPVLQDPPKGKRERAQHYGERAIADLRAFAAIHAVPLVAQ
jgi:methylenetetrahydrofolate--tRNA-(uracil-5-)-methyltransferase